MARFVPALVTAVATLLLVACTTSEPSGQTSSDEAGIGITDTFDYGFDSEFTSYQANSSGQNSVANALILNQVIGGFWNYDPSGGVAPDLEYGTYSKVADDPLTVEYSFASSASWSDGEPLDCDDFKLAWVANAGLDSGRRDPETGDAVVLFGPASPTGYDDIDIVECADGDKDITVTFAEPFVDWMALFGATAILPAHVVEREAGIDDIIPLIDAGDAAGLASADDFYRTEWTFNPGELPDPSLIPASGPYRIAAWEAGQSLTLARNDDFWGAAALSSTIVVRYIPAEQQAQALKNGEIDAMDPQPNPELVAQLRALGDAVEFSTHDQFVWDHLDFNFRTAFADRDLREAFARCVPRQLIVDNLVRPQNPEALVLNSRKYLPFQAEYEDALAGSYDERYDQVDLEGARGLLATSGYPQPVPVRIGYLTPNQRQTDTVALIRDSCGTVGFDVQDAGSRDFYGNALINGNFDVALFGWAGSALISGDASAYTTDGGNNLGGYANSRVDDLTARRDRSLDPDTATRLNIDIDEILWDDLVTIPLFAAPGIVATVQRAQGVEYNPSQNGLMWNADQWVITGD